MEPKSLETTASAASNSSGPSTPDPPSPEGEESPKGHDVGLQDLGWYSGSPWLFRCATTAAIVVGDVGALDADGLGVLRLAAKHVPMPMRFSAPVESRMTRESMPEATVSPMRQVMFL